MSNTDELCARLLEHAAIHDRETSPYSPEQAAWAADLRDAAALIQAAPVLWIVRHRDDAPDARPTVYYSEAEARRHAAQYLPGVARLVALFEPAAPAVPPEWQPIETAPKDGTDFLAFKTQVLGGPCICVCTWLDSDHPSYDGETPHVAWDHSGFWDATHWMPLPSAPTHQPGLQVAAAPTAQQEPKP